MAVSDTHVFPGFLIPVLPQLFFPKPPTTFLTCFCRGERRKYAVKKVRLNRVSNSQPPGHESDTLTTEPPGQGRQGIENDNERERERKRQTETDVETKRYRDKDQTDIVMLISFKHTSIYFTSIEKQVITMYGGPTWLSGQVFDS